MQDVSDLAFVQAWQTAAMVGAAQVGKLPELSKLLANRAAVRERLSAAQQRTQAALVSEHLGIAMRPISEAAKSALRRLGARRG